MLVGSGVGQERGRLAHFFSSQLGASGEFVSESVVARPNMGRGGAIRIGHFEKNLLSLSFCSWSLKSLDCEGGHEFSVKGLSMRERRA